MAKKTKNIMGQILSLTRKSGGEYPNRDICPEHTKRNVDDDTLDIEVSAAYDYVNSVVDTSDYIEEYLWHGWGIRESFLSGISYAKKSKENKFSCTILKQANMHNPDDFDTPHHWLARCIADAQSK